MPLLTLPNEVLVEIAKHLEPHDRSLGALRMLGHSTRFLRVVRHKPTFCSLWGCKRLLHARGIALRNIITCSQFTGGRHGGVQGATYPDTHSLQLRRILSPRCVKNVFKVFPNLKALIVPRSAIAHLQLDRVQSRSLHSRHDHIDAIVDFLALQTGARAVTFHLTCPISRMPVNSPIGKYGWHDEAHFSNFDPRGRDSAPTGLLSDWDPTLNDTQFEVAYWVWSPGP